MKKNQLKSSNYGGSREGAGRKPGSPNKSNLQIKEIVQSEVDFNSLIAKLFTTAMQGDAQCAKILLEYGFGKPKQTLELEGEAGLITIAPVINVKPNKGD